MLGPRMPGLEVGWVELDKVVGQIGNECDLDHDP